MQKRNLVLKVAAALVVGSLALTGCTTTPDKPNTASTNASKRQAIDASVDATLSRLYSTVKGSRELVAKSRGVLVFPDVIQAGFIVGGQTGNGALRVSSLAGTCQRAAAADTSMARAFAPASRNCCHEFAIAELPPVPCSLPNARFA